MPPEKLKEVEEKAKQLMSDTQPLRDKVRELQPATPLEENTKISAAAADNVAVIGLKIDIIFEWMRKRDVVIDELHEEHKQKKWIRNYIIFPLAAVAFNLLCYIIAVSWPAIATWIKSVI